ncbi:MAG TPA: FecR domain-containing protein [Brevundimonas diminuta]|nr:FecR domain-containing protein [Brevundimonas diminuta]
MFPVHPRSNDEEAVDPAAFWFARMNGGDTPSPQDEIAFRRWLDEDPGHIRDYRACQQAWRMLDLEAGQPEVLALRAAALGRADRGATRRRALLGLTGGAIAASCGGLWVMTASSPARALIATEAGQRLTAPLPDGSEVTLAPSSRLRLDYGAERRAAVLEAGQAYFHIQPDAEPFVLRVGDRLMATAQGRFQATHADRGPEALVEQGRLRVVQRGGAGAPLILTAGQGGLARGDELRAAPADVEAETAWRMGRLVVRDRPLREVVERFNRYSAERLTLTDAAAGEIRISGSFRYDGGQEFALALARGFGLSVRRTTDGDWRIGSPDKASDETAAL